MPRFRSSNYARAVKAAQGERLPTLRLVSVPLFKAVFRLLKALSRGRQRKQLSNLGLFLDYMGESQSFDNRRSRALLSKAGIALPSPESYLEGIFGFEHQAAADRVAAGPSVAGGPEAAAAARWLGETPGIALRGPADLPAPRLGPPSNGT